MLRIIMIDIKNVKYIIENYNKYAKFIDILVKLVNVGKRP